jgi:WD40 repeat protein
MTSDPDHLRGRPSPASGEATLPPAAAAPAPPAGLTTPLPAPSSAAGPDCAARVPGYEILGELGRGGMGVVYKARHLGLNRVVALKMILAGGHAGPDELARFRGEAEAAARLKHPNVVQVYDVGEVGGLPYFSLEFVEGSSLDRKLAGTPLPPQEAAPLVETLAQAMAAAHAAGLVHRDLKPANVLLTADGTPKVTDFGLAKKLDAAGLTATGAVLGTPSYMAPEQAGGKSKEIGPACDVYALGAILYECLTGRPPFKATTQLDTILQVVSDEPVPPAQLQSKTPRDLETICLKCLQKQPNRRYASAAVVADELRRFQNGESILGRPAGVIERAGRWVKRRPAAAALLMVSVFAGVTVAGAVGTAASLLYDRNRELSDVNTHLTDERNRAKTAEEEAKSQTEQAVLARGLADRQKSRAEGERDRAETARHAIQMDLALRAWERHDQAAAEAILNDVPATFRDTWEFRHLRDVCRRSCLVLKGGTNQSVLAPLGRREWLWRTYAGVSFSPDGGRLLAAADSQSVRVWDARTGEENLLIKAGADAAVLSVCFSVDGRRLAAGFNDGMVRVWDARTGKEELAFKAQGVNVTGVCFSADGQQLATASLDETSPEAKVWDAQTGKNILTLTGHADAASSVCFSPDGKRLATASGDETVRVWDATTGKEILTIKVKDNDSLPEPEGAEPAQDKGFSLKLRANAVWGLQFSPDGRRLAGVAEDGAAWVWDATTGKEVLGLKAPAKHQLPQPFRAVCFSPDGKRLATGSEDRTVRVWDAQSGKQLVAFLGHIDKVYSVAFSPDGQRLASAAADRTVRVWDPKSVEESSTLRVSKEWVLDVCFSPDGARLATASLLDKTARVWDVATGREAFALTGHSSFVLGVCFSHDGQNLATNSGDGTLRVWDGRTGREAHTFKIRSGRGNRGEGHAVCFSPDDKRLAAACEESDYETEEVNKVRVWDLEAAQEALTLKESGYNSFSLCFSRDGKRLAATTGEKVVRVCDSRTGEEVFSLNGHAGEVTCVAYSPDGERIATASSDGTARLWDATTGKEVQLLKGNAGALSALCFSPDGKRLACAAGDETIRLWDLPMGQEVFTLRGHADQVTGVRFSPDGNRLVSASRDGTVKLWDAPTGDADLPEPR